MSSDTPPAGYLIMEIEVTDPKAYKAYQAMALPALEAAGGRVIAGGGRMEVLEGDWRSPGLYVVAFDSFIAARSFYYSAAYRAAIALRKDAARVRALLMEGR